jgi:hypothetical protein
VFSGVSQRWSSKALQKALYKKIVSEDVYKNRQKTKTQGETQKPIFSWFSVIAFPDSRAFLGDR